MAKVWRRYRHWLRSHCAQGEHGGHDVAESRGAPVQKGRKRMPGPGRTLPVENMSQWQAASKYAATNNAAHRA